MFHREIDPFPRIQFCFLGKLRAQDFISNLSHPLSLSHNTVEPLICMWPTPILLPSRAFYMPHLLLYISAWRWQTLRPATKMAAWGAQAPSGTTHGTTAALGGASMDQRPSALAIAAFGSGGLRER
jgi:hypothetical protein